MKTNEDIIREYTNADMARRLNLYLQYRDLRGTFYQVDVKERHPDERKIADRKRSDRRTAPYHERGWWRRVFVQELARR